MKVDLLIRRVCVDDDRPLVDIAIRDGRIAAIEAGIEVDAAQEIDAAGRADRKSVV